jgi:hypothetical protein
MASEDNTENIKGEVAKYLEEVGFNITKELVELYQGLDDDIVTANAGLNDPEGVDIRTATFYTGVSMESKKLKQKVLASLQTAVDKEQEIAIKKQVADRADKDKREVMNLRIPTYRREFIEGKYVMIRDDQVLSISSDEVL